MDLASLFPPKKLHWLSQEEIRLFKIENMSVELEKWKLDTTESGSVFVHIIQTKPGIQSRVGLLVVKEAETPKLVIYFEPTNPTTKRLEEAKDALNSTGSLSNDVSLIVDQQEIATYKRPSWSKLGQKAIATSLILSPQTVQRLSTGKKMEISINVAHVDEEYNQSLEFPLEGLSRLLLAVLK